MLIILGAFSLTKLNSDFCFVFNVFLSNVAYWKPSYFHYRTSIQKRTTVWLAVLWSFKLIWTIIRNGSIVSVVSLSEWPAAGLCSGPDEASASSADWEEPQWPHWPGELLYFVIMSDCLAEQTHLQCRLCALQTCLKNAQTSLPWKVWFHYMFTGGFEFPRDTFVSCILDHDWPPNYF